VGKLGSTEHKKQLSYLLILDRGRAGSGLLGGECRLLLPLPTLPPKRGTRVKDLYGGWGLFRYANATFA